jgi:cellulose synthase/poly-beta-1,6-N-acetylglucosamine synthase-like glycosyltransferase
VKAGLPAVSVVVAVRDEASRLPQRIQNLLDSDYPADRFEIIVASDGSSDDTASAVAPFAGRVRLLRLPPAGKAAALNAGVAHARHPIVVFADARQRFAPDAIRRLVAPFSDPQIGAVSGELVLDCEQQPTGPAGRGEAHSTVADGVGAYWRYEKWLRRHEAAVDSTVGVTGAIYAMRRWLWQPLPVNTLLDDVLTPMRIVMRGHRVTFEAGARAFDAVAKDSAGERRRKVRTLAGNFQLLAGEPRLLLPGANPVWLQFVSHKIGRLLVPYALVAVLLASLVLAPRSLFYAAAFAAQVLFYGLAAYGALLERRTHQRPVTTGEVFHEAA